MRKFIVLDIQPVEWLSEGLRVVTVNNYLLLREDGFTLNINPNCLISQIWRLGRVGGKGYRSVRVPYTGCVALHRLLALAFIENTNPSKLLVVDHIDGDILNNNLDNLRWVTFRTNNSNKKRHREGELLGAKYDPRYGTWSSAIVIGKRALHLGTFKTAKEANQAYKTKWAELGYL